MLNTLQEVEERLKWPLTRDDMAQVAYDHTALIVVHRESGRIVGATREVDSIFGHVPGRIGSGQMKLEDLIPKRFRAAHADHFAQFWKSPQSRPMGQPTGENDPRAAMTLLGLAADGETEFEVVISLRAAVIKQTDCALAEIAIPRKVIRH